MPLKPIEVQSQERMVAMVIGEPGVGKTSLVKTIPKDQKVCVISAESGLLSVIEEVRSGHVSGFEVETFDDLIDIFNHLNEEESKASYQWVFIDSLTEIGERCFEHIKKQYPTDKDTLRAWSKYGERFQKLIKAFRDLKPYNVVFTCLPKINKDENNVRFKGADVPGKAVAEKLPAYFDEATVPAHPRVLHLDLHLHQAVLTELAGRQSLRRGRVELAPRVGLRSLHESWARWVAGSMVGRTRFDPLHHAASEQSLMDRLPEWLELLERREEVEAAIDSPHGRLAVPFTREDALLAAEAFYAQLVELVRGQLQGEPVTVLLGHRTRSLPGLVERLAALPGVEARRLEPGAVARGVAQWPGMGEGGLLIALPRSVPLPSEPVSETVPARAPTHLLHAGQAHRLQEGELCVGLDPAGDRQLRLAGRPTGVSRQHCRLVASAGRVELLDDSRYGTWVNGRRVQGSVLLSPGDKLRVGTPGVILDLIEVE